MINSAPYPVTTPPGFWGTLVSPAFLKPIALFSVVMNVLLLVGLITSASGGGNGGPSITPIPNLSNSPTPGFRPTILPTKAPGERESELITCFSNCTENDVIRELKTELKNVKHVKMTSSKIASKSKECTGKYVEATAPDREFSTTFLPVNCPVDYRYKSLPSEYRLGNKSYLLADKWEQGTISASLQPSIFDVVELISKQQVLTSQTDGDLRTLTGTSKTVNEFNQAVERTVTITINTSFELVSYSDAEKGSYAEYGNIYDYQVANDIKAPL